MSDDISPNNINLTIDEKEEEDRSPMERRLTVDVHDDIIDKALELVDISRNIPESVRTVVKSSIKLKINPAEIDLDARNDSNANVQLNARIIKENKANKQRQQNQHLKVKSNISLQQSSQASGSNKRSNTVNAVKTKELNGK